MHSARGGAPEGEWSRTTLTTAFAPGTGHHCTCEVTIEVSIIDAGKQPQEGAGAGDI
jgi:hypothetical protein